jgi:hypothetical protein
MDGIEFSCIFHFQGSVRRQFGLDMMMSINFPVEDLVFAGIVGKNEKVTTNSVLHVTFEVSFPLIFAHAIEKKEK